MVAGPGARRPAVRGGLVRGTHRPLPRQRRRRLDRGPPRILARHGRPAPAGLPHHQREGGAPVSEIQERALYLVRDSADAPDLPLPRPEDGEMSTELEPRTSRELE